MGPRMWGVVLAMPVLLSQLSLGHTEPSELTQAYRKEFAFLEAEKNALLKRLSELDREYDQQVGQEAARVEKLERQVIGMRAQADDIELTLHDVERQTTSAEERSELIQETIERAFRSMRQVGFEVPKQVAEKPADQAEQIEQMFALAGRAIEQSGSVRQEKNAFFSGDGTLITGDVIRVGNVAAYGISDTAAGALAPAGAGRLKLWPDEASASARDMLEKKSPSTLAIFLFETLDKGIEEKKTKTALRVIRSGGPIAWIIVCLGGVSLLLIVLRIVILLLASSRTDRLLKSVSLLMIDGAREKALKACKQAKGAAARVLRATIRNLDRDRAHLEDIVSEAILHESPFIERFGSTILVIAAVAPLLGLLGTVTGMISTFDVITEFGTGDPKLLSGGISEALVTTELGLIVAIPTLLIGTLLSGRAASILQTMERAALQVMNLAEDPAVKEKLAPERETESAPESDPTPEPETSGAANPQTVPVQEVS